MIGDLLARLESLGILDEAILVVTADHGISFRTDTPRRDITDGNAYEVGLVPLFIKAPHQDKGVVDTTPARTIDVMPTVAELLGMELPWAHEGQSLIGYPREAPPLVVQAAGGEDILLGNVEQGVRDVTADVEALFGDEHGSFDLYSLGAYDSLVGLTTAGLAFGPSELAAEVEEIWRLSHVAPYTGFVPGFLHGHLVGKVDEDVHVAVALNGVVGTVVPVFDPDGEESRFNALLPDEAFVAGYNDLELFAVSGPSNAPVIETVALEGNTRFQMENAEDGRVTRLLDSEGGSWPVVQRSTVTGYVDAAGWPEAEYETFGPKDLYLHGWAVDRRSMKPVDRVVYFANEVFAGSARIDVERSANAEFYESDDVLVSGFVGRLAHFLPSQNMKVRAFALFDGNAHELPITDVALADIYAG
jgi:Sulfatase